MLFRSDAIVDHNRSSLHLRDSLLAVLVKNLVTLTFEPEPDRAILLVGAPGVAQPVDVLKVDRPALALAVRPAITAAALTVLHDAGGAETTPFAQRARRYCEQHLQAGVDTTGHHYYAQLYWSQALWQRGERPWAEYHERLGEWLRREQLRDGTWDGDGVGPVYGTAIASIAMHLPYAFVPIYQR